ncbi:lysosomal acid phosphatase-like [Hetaerina americana]|uniref:lysosomal acid phosphatase-like n=1 Tax=Hetaerina americana TaxID=62018 RepID=UPI003A7F4D04
MKKFNILQTFPAVNLFHKRIMAKKLSILLSLLVFCLSGASIEACQPPCTKMPAGTHNIYTAMVYRHGERNPISEYPKSEYANESNWKEGFGQLTLRGMKQHFEFGKWIMERYGPKGLRLLPAVYNARDYKVVSTDFDRTMMSAMSNNAGLYMPSQTNALREGLKWNPVPVRNIEANEYDEIFGQFCPKMSEKLNKLIEDRFKELQMERPEVFSYADKYSGYGIEKNPLRIYWLYDTAFIEQTQKGRIPEWMQPIYPQPLRSYFYEFLKQYVRTDEMKRLTAGPTLKTIVQTMTKKISGMETVKLDAYSAHDNNVFNILSTLGLEPKELPKYTSAVIFELYETPQNLYYVKLLYRPGPGTVPLTLVMPGCDGSVYCPLESFIEIVEPYLPGNWIEECQAETTKVAELALNRKAFMEKFVYPHVR